jgi:hypothetical protein
MPDGRIGFAVRSDWDPEPHSGVLNHEAAGGSDEGPQVLLSYPHGAPGTWTRGGELLFGAWGDDTGFDLWSVTLDGVAAPWLETKYHESQPALSPDDNWLAYASTEANEWEIFVVSYPDGKQKRRVSRNGGLAPVWSADGSELFYREGGWVMSVAWNGLDSVPPPRRLFEDRYWMGIITHMERNYDVGPDGRFLMLEAVEEEEEPARVVVVQHWFDELSRLVPVE